MAHVLYNHMTHSWDNLYAEDSWSEHDGCHEEPVEFSPAARLLIARLALAAATTVGGIALWGLMAGVLLGIT